MNSNENNASRFHSIQALRAFAALYVVIYHARIPLPFFDQSVSEQWMNFQMRGFIGVDIFFVICGFVMAWVGVLSGRSKDNPASFIVKRLFRVAPPYWIATLLTTYIIGSVVAGSDLIRSLMFLPLSEGDAPFYGYAALYVGWSLNYEILFYFIFAVALFLRSGVLFFVIVTLLALVFITPFYFDEKLTVSPYRVFDVPARFLALSSNPMMMNFVLGIITAYIYSLVRGKIPKFAVVLIAIISMALMINVLSTYSGGHDVIKVGVPAAILLFGMVVAEDAKVIKFPSVFVWLGNISFSIYLVHPLIISLLDKYIPIPVSPGAFYGKFIFLIGCVVVISNYWYKNIELPFQNLGLLVIRKMQSFSAEYFSWSRYIRVR